MVRISQLLGNKQKRLINAALVVGGGMIADEAKASIMAGSVSGANHVVSAPGSAPNNDSHVLHDGVEVVNTALNRVEVRSTAPYSNDLERGTSKMAARPFMTPARDKMEKPVRRYVQREVSRILRS